MASRRDRWREFLGRFAPSADPGDAIGRGFYVPRPGRSVAEQLAARYEVKPGASHLLVGGPGSGKTTQLLVARERLEQAGDVCAAYVDVSLQVDPDGVTSTDLLALAGIELARQLGDRITEEITSNVHFFRSWFDPGEHWTSEPFEAFTEDLRAIKDALAARYSDIVLLIDSLDRMSNLDRFARIVEQGVIALRSNGIGVILVGPLTSLYGLQRVVHDRFDRVWHLPPVDVQNDGEGRDFLLRVMRARDPENQLPPASAERLADLSGGVLRDLIALVQAAGEEAYVDGAEAIDLKHVDIAADLFGRKHMVGLDSEQLVVLQRVRTKGTFVQTSEKDLALLATRRVLEYANGKPRFAVHPTIEPLLAQIEGAP